MLGFGSLHATTVLSSIFPGVSVAFTTSPAVISSAAAVNSPVSSPASLMSSTPPSIVTGPISNSKFKFVPSCFLSMFCTTFPAVMMSSAAVNPPMSSPAALMSSAPVFTGPISNTEG